MPARPRYHVPPPLCNAPGSSGGLTERHSAPPGMIENSLGQAPALAPAKEGDTSTAEQDEPDEKWLVRTGLKKVHEIH